MNLLKKLTLFALIFITANFAFAQNETNQGAKEEAFEPGELIMEHIGDAYEWHVATFGDFHLSLPLPCIVYSEKTGLHVFSSSNLHHGEQEFEGFRISESENYKGKLVEIIDGEEVRPWDFWLHVSGCNLW